MLLEINEHLADAAAGGPPPVADEDAAAAAGLAHQESELLDPAYIQTLLVLAEKKVREAEAKAKLDEEADWAAAADSSSNTPPKEDGGNADSPTTDDILQLIEESVDFNNQTCGFVSTFALPLTPIAHVSTDDVASDSEELDDCDDSDDYSAHDVRESLPSRVSEDESSDKNIYANNKGEKIEIARQQGAASPASIFRTASSSSSASHSKFLSSPSSPFDDSIASDSTEFTGNTSLPVITPLRQPQPQQDNIEGKAIPPLAIPIITSFEKKPMMSNDHVNEHARMPKPKLKQQVPIQRPKVKTKRSKSNEQPQTTSWTKRKNNLVISPIPISKKPLSQRKKSPQSKKATMSIVTKPTSTTTSNTQTTTRTSANAITNAIPIQLSNKPPTHPSIKPSSSPSKPSSSPSFHPILRTHSHMSDAEVSVDLSEATPITTPAKSSWFRTYSSEDEDEEGGVGLVGRKDGDYWGSSGPSVDNDAEEENDECSGSKEDSVNDDINYRVGKKISQSSTDLVGLEIFEFDANFPGNDDITPKNNNFSTTNNNRDELLLMADDDVSLSSSTEYTVSSYFNPTSNRQYSNENLFFHGIYESGLQSSSFEQVDNAEDMMCMEAEIELVYNLSGTELPSFFLDGDTDSSFASSVVADDLDECASVEERREVVRRIQQWRRGRAKQSFGSTKDDSVCDDGCDGGGVEEDENAFNYDDDAIEMSPLTSGQSDNGVGDLHGFNNPDGYNQRRTHTINNSGWRMTSPTIFFGNLLRQLQASRDESSSRRRSKPHYDDIDFDRNTDKCYQCLARWKKLMIISIIFLLFGSLLSGGGLEKHHSDESYNAYGKNDPLAKRNFIEQGRLPDDSDDYDGLLSYHSSGVTTHLRNDADIMKNFQQSAKPGLVADDVWFRFEIEDDEFDKPFDLELLQERDAVNDATTAGPSATILHRAKSEQYNALIGIDSIVVLGDHLSGLEWLVDKLKRLYPDLVIQNGFEGNADNNGRALRGRKRITKVIDPLSNEVIHQLGGADGNEAKAIPTDSKHILVVALFLNPYDWVALMHASQRTNETSWKDYLSTEWESYESILEYRANMINSAVRGSMERGDVKLVIPLKYEKLIAAFSNFDNYVSSSGTATPDLPGIVGVIDEIQSRTGLRADEAAGWNQSRDHNPFWADPIGCNGSVCHPKIQKLREDTEYISYINDHMDWKTESLIGYQQMMTPKPSVEQIVVLGERHSGAEWLVDRLSLCFPEINVKYGFDPRPGKFFQTEPTNAQANTLVISIFVNPFDWVDMMRRNPINAPTHKDLDWTDFVTRHWERKRSNMDENLKDTTSAVCSFGFSYSEVIPCMTQRDPTSDSFPLYELRPDGTPYSNLLELREDKIKNFLSAANFAGVVDHISIRYEDLVWDDGYTDDGLYLTLPFPGIAGLLEKIRDQTKLIPDVNAGWIIDEGGVFRAEQLGVGLTKLDPYFVQWMEDNVDWDVEDLVGYSL
jgi:hypothetical protein